MAATKDRYLPEIIDLILPLVPADEVEFRKQLEWSKNDALFKPPEGQSACWIRVGDAFFQRFGATPPTDGWGKKIVDIFMGTLAR